MWNRAALLAILSLAAAAPCPASADALPSATRPADPGGLNRTAADRHLLLESDLIERADGVHLVPGRVVKDPRNPLFGEDKPWEPRFDNLYANVLFDESAGLYRLWYSPFIVDEATTKTPPEERKAAPYIRCIKAREMGLCYAFSRDGIAWTKPDLGLVAFDGSTKNNLVMRVVHGSGVMRDVRDADPTRRFKLFALAGEGLPVGVAFSADGLRWSSVRPCPEIRAEGDTHNNAFWDAASRRYVGITRLWRDRQRVVGRTESEDFERWTPAEEVLRGTLDRQVYAMPVFRHAGVYLGLAMILNADDTVDCELAWSRDTRRWERVCPGRPLISRGAKGGYDGGCIYAAACPITRDGEIRLYYGGNDDTHGGWRKGYFCLARLRPDGFAGMETIDPARPGTILTRPVACLGSKLCVTADVAAGGSLRAAVLDTPGLALEACEPLSGSLTDATVRWRGARDLASRKGTRIRLAFELRAATLYSYGFAE